MPSVDEAVRWAEGIAADDRIGYDQADRDSDHAVDCSSLVCRALHYAGFDTPLPSFSTRNMGTWLEAHDWVWHKGTFGVRRGDILWMSGHTAFAASSTTIVEAYPHGTPLWGDERGDNNGREVLIDRLTVHKWAGYWRYTGEESEMTDKDIEKIAQAVWNYQLGSEGKMHYQNVPAWQHLSFAHYDTARLYQIATDTSDPTGRGVEMDDHDHIKWIAAGQAKQNDVLASIVKELSYIVEELAAVKGEVDALEAVKAEAESVKA